MGIHRQSTRANVASRGLSTPAKIYLLALGSILLLSAPRQSLGADKGVVPVDGGELIGRASKVSADSGNLVSLAKAGHGVKLAGGPMGGTLAVRHALVEVGTISVAVDGGPARKVNVHSSGNAAKSFLNAKIQLAVPAGATQTITRGDASVGENIRRITVGHGELGLPPDIWNSPELKVVARPFPADWKGLAAKYTAPEWWHDAKFGAGSDGAAGGQARNQYC